MTEPVLLLFRSFRGDGVRSARHGTLSRLPPFFMHLYIRFGHFDSRTLLFVSPYLRGLRMLGASLLFLGVTTGSGRGLGNPRLHSMLSQMRTGALALSGHYGGSRETRCARTCQKTILRIDSWDHFGVLPYRYA
jgi:hypothetical protein